MWSLTIKTHTTFSHSRFFSATFLSTNFQWMSRDSFLNAATGNDDEWHYRVLVRYTAATSIRCRREKRRKEIASLPLSSDLFVFCLSSSSSSFRRVRTQRCQKTLTETHQQLRMKSEKRSTIQPILWVGVYVYIVTFQSDQRPRKIYSLTVR